MDRQAVLERQPQGRDVIARRWDVFCKVVDNFGDIGVCWRLARQLHDEFGLHVVLWLDDPASLARMCPDASAHARTQWLDGVTVERWDETTVVDELGEVVIEAFACSVPASVVSLMRAQQPGQSVWLNLEYLSAEPWVAGCHELASPQGHGLQKFFFFPGFTGATGGLIAEREMRAARAGWGDHARAHFLGALGIQPRAGALLTSLFAYENEALPGLLDAWAAGAAPVHCLVPEGRILPQLQAWLGEPVTAGATRERGALTISVMPFISQTDYDRLLWSCDLNFVRGEDSFVRAQWARMPLVWQIYRQEEEAHLEKLDAWLALYLAELPAGTRAAAAAFVRAWNLEKGAGTAWPAFAAVLPQLRDYAGIWAERLLANGNLADNLVNFTQGKLK
ncbi:elongation factor P maturation arginine rhamnosyltransferase EarP [Jeongeupia naejangsanensis]|uniref:Protein-arginine rhamnosyltransferase n=1 Tax=Jeongeupia naejangsanensis TaxID=613195 RepID=A0ABS2BQA3_9NEIS|nr:elongation factor P maturation arginine rhamnosyltransferase EarP [Jeongeupia naejangsanensis]MBM3117819.1 elongation factor P maturation arginine rhamnosyltransferase EarP [Jeongeupia naejangsanensis]